MMKPVSDLFLQIQRSGVAIQTRYLLTDGTQTINLTPRVEPTSIDEEVEDDEFNVGSGDLVLILDDSDRFLLGDGVGKVGIWDNVESGDWLLLVERSYQHAPDELISWFGYVRAESIRRVRADTAVQCQVLSMTSLAKATDAWDGTPTGRVLYNPNIDALLTRMIGLLDRFDLMDLDLPSSDPLFALGADGRYFQPFDTGIDTVSELEAGPGTMIYLGSDSGRHRFWVNIQSGFGSYILEWDQAQQTVVSLLAILGNIPGGARDHALATPSAGGNPRVWILFDDHVELHEPDAGGGTLVRSYQRTDAPYSQMEWISAAVDDGGQTFRAVGLKPAGGFTSSVAVFQMDADTGGVAIAADVSNNSSDPDGVGYLPLGGGAASSQWQGAVVNSVGTRILFVSETIAWVIQITPIQVPLSTTSLSSGSYKLGGQIRYVETETADGWGALFTRYSPSGTETGGHDNKGFAGVLVTADITSAAKVLTIDGIAAENFALDFTPDDDVGLLAYDHPDNPGTLPSDDETIEDVSSMAVDRDYAGFSAVITGPLGIGVRNFRIPDYATGATLVESVALVKSDADVDAPPAAGLQMGGIDGLPSPFFIQPVAFGTALQDDRRIALLIRQPQTSPAFFRVPLHESNVYTVMTKAVTAVGASLYFRWDDATGRILVSVRSRGIAYGEFTGSVPGLIDVEVGSLDERYFTRVTVEGALGSRAEFPTGKTPGQRTLPISNDFVSPSFAPLLAEREQQFFSVKRRPVVATLADMPQIELLDIVPLYSRRHAATFRTLLLSRSVDEESGTVQWAGVTV